MDAKAHHGGGMDDKDPKADRSVLDWLGFRDTLDLSKLHTLGTFLGFAGTLVAIVLVVGAIINALVVLYGPIFAFGKNGSNAAGGLTLGAGALIAFILGAPFVIWGTYLRQRSVEFQKEGLITDRINKAVEMLGAEKTKKKHLVNSSGIKVFEKNAAGEPDYSRPAYIEETVPNIEVRIGGLLSLERIAQDSVRYDQGRDHVRVMEILCAYVRENAKFDIKLGPADLNSVANPRLDIQQAITIIGSRSEPQKVIERRLKYRLDLSSTCLARVSFFGGDFSAAKFLFCDLRSSNFGKCNLSGGDFFRSVISYSSFREALLKGAMFCYADYEAGSRFDFVRARFEGVFIHNANFPGFEIRDAYGKEVFGNPQTTLSEHDERSKNSALYELKKINPHDELELAALAEKYPDAVVRFRYWCPYDADDTATGEYVENFRELHNLFGWPYQD